MRSLLLRPLPLLLVASGLAAQSTRDTTVATQISLAESARISASSPRLTTAPSAAQLNTRVPSAAQLRWMAGCWERRRGARLVEEQWMTPRGGMMLGAGRTMRGDTLVEYEHTRIYERDGRLIFAAAPSGQPPAEFEAAEASDSMVTFSNPKHDFPQRITYRRNGADSLFARVEGVEEGKLHGIDFPYRRTPCF
jgi:uncharacterized protein DUF6265